MDGPIRLAVSERKDLVHPPLLLGDVVATVPIDAGPRGVEGAA
jgi:hypothetical protein